MAEKPLLVAASIGQRALSLVVGLLVMVMVEHSTGQQGLGIFAYLSACLYAARYLADYGVSNYIERETARISSKFAHYQLWEGGLQATMLTGLGGAAILLATAGFDTAHTRIQERMAAYVIIASLLPLANLNQLSLAILNGRGDHGQVARLRALRQCITLATIFLLTSIGLRPSYLLIAWWPAEIVLALKLRGHIKLPRWRGILKNPQKARETLRKGRAYLFTDNALDLLLNVDLFVLGLFVTSRDLGVYAEAAMLVRFFLIVPEAIKPILRRNYTIAATQSRPHQLFVRANRTTALLFGLHAVMALIILLHFPAILALFFHTRIDVTQSFHIFATLVPGLIFYGAFSAQEPLYEALDRAEDLKHITLTGAGINLVLSFYLIPAVGFYGAAAATTITMLVYVVLFGRQLDKAVKLEKKTLFIAGFGTYLVYVLLKWLAWNAAITLLTAPLMLGVLFYACGMFGVKTNKPITEKQN